MRDDAVAVLDLPPGLSEALELALAPDERGHTAGIRDLEAAHGTGGSQHAVDVDGPGDPLELSLPKGSVSK